MRQGLGRCRKIRRKQKVADLAERLAAVAQTILFFRRRLGVGAPAIRKAKNRIVTETVCSARLGRKNPFGQIGDNGQRASPPRKSDDADKSRAALVSRFFWLFVLAHVPGATLSDAALESTLAAFRRNNAVRLMLSGPT